MRLLNLLRRTGHCYANLIRLLYVYHKRGVVKRSTLISRICTFIELAAVGSDREDDSFSGYLRSVHGNLEGEESLLREACEESKYLAEIRAALLVAQMARFEPNEKVPSGPTPTRPRDVLPTLAQAVVDVISECGLHKPAPADVRHVLEEYRMFSPAEIDALVTELPNWTAL